MSYFRSNLLVIYSYHEMADLQLWKKTNQLQLLISTLYRSSFGGKVQKASFLAHIHYQKLHLFVVDFLGIKLT